MTIETLERTAAVLGIIFGARAWAGWRAAKRQKAALTTPLFDASLLEAALAPRVKDGDDANLLAELRDTFTHLNRRAYADEFWNLHTQIAALHSKLGPPQQSTLRRALVRLLLVNDRWLQLVAAQSCAALNIQEAAPPLKTLLETDAGKGKDSKAEATDLRYRGELETALARLEDGVTKM